MINLCPLCRNTSELFYSKKETRYHICNFCKGIFIDKKNLPDKNSEKKRYLNHNNDVNDLGYQKFVQPTIDAIIEDFSTTDEGLDFGSGPGPVIFKLLHDKNYNIVKYDIFFDNFPELLKSKYDYIICNEVIEHFHNPAKEFELLKNLLTSKGKLYCSTNIFNNKIDFNNWYYKNDKTHVFFYQKETFEYIHKKFNFSSLKIFKNLIIFSN